jgi:hypothetical protein
MLKRQAPTGGLLHLRDLRAAREVADGVGQHPGHRKPISGIIERANGAAALARARPRLAADADRLYLACKAEPERSANAECKDRQWMASSMRARGGQQGVSAA